MRIIMVMYDSLSKNYLSSYGNKEVITPNFNRLNEKCVKFNKFFVGSMPCMPARRELHTGRYNFLHRGWGPIEPFDESMPEILKQNGVYSHLVTDHYHYLEDGGCTYHNRYSSWECFRGQEGDFWKGEVKMPPIPECEPAGLYKAKLVPTVWKQDWVNRRYMDCDEKMPQSQTFKAGIEFIETNKNEDNWFLQIETFDPHEPFFTQKEYKDLYPHDYSGKHFDWPPYGPVRESEELVNHVKNEYSALVSMCDTKLGLVLDEMDKYNMWDDTMLIVCTDHGFLLGEHNWWAKGICPLYNEVANTPFFIYDPRFKDVGECNLLAQTIDIAPTILDFFNLDIPKNMQGKPLKNAYNKNEIIHQNIIYGYFGGNLNITDGTYTYLKAPMNNEIYEYTLMPTNMRGMFSEEQMKSAEMFSDFDFIKDYKVMKIQSKNMQIHMHNPIDLLFNIKEDEKQLNSIQDDEIKLRLTNQIIDNMRENDAPKELYAHFNLPTEGKYTIEMMQVEEENIKKLLSEFKLNEDFYLKNGRDYLLHILPFFEKGAELIFYSAAQKYISQNKSAKINEEIAEKILINLNLKWNYNRPFNVISNLYKAYVK